LFQAFISVSTGTVLTSFKMAINLNKELLNMSYAPINHSLDFMQEIPHFFNPATGREESITGAGPIGTYRGGTEMEPIGTYKGGAIIEELPFLENFMEENQLADLSDYRRRWINHTSGKDVITDPIYRKNLQDIILYPDRFGFGNVRV
jgi:hypothetical protein